MVIFFIFGKLFYLVALFGDLATPGLLIMRVVSAVEVTSFVIVECEKSTGLVRGDPQGPEMAL